ncbi:MAG: RCC1 domain-containing protein [Caldilineaceae bacterium]
MSLSSPLLRAMIGHVFPLIAVFAFAQPALAQEEPVALPEAPVVAPVAAAVAPEQIHATLPMTDAPPPLLGDVSVIAAGGYHTCALGVGGGVLCWGSDQYGQLGDGMFARGGGLVDQTAPVDVLGLLTGAKAITAGFRHTCALTFQGGVKCWGSDEYGQVGDGNGATNEPIAMPVAVQGLSSGIQAISAGNSHTCALTTAGGVLCWGSDNFGQLGNGAEFDQATPVEVVGLSSGVKAIAAGGFHTCALLTNGAAKCWGSDFNGQLGDGGLDVGQQTPVNVQGMGSGVLAIATGFGHTCAITSSHGVMCWGWDDMGQLGNDGEIRDSAAPVAVAGLAADTQLVSTGFYHTCAAMTAGTAKCWGDNSEGQLGNDKPSYEERMPAFVLDLGPTAVQIVGGSAHTCARTREGRVKCWGADSRGQLGDGGDTEEKPKPVDVKAAIPRLMLPLVVGPK